MEPSSLYVPPTGTMTVEEPFRVITGRTVSVTEIVLVTGVATFPCESVTEYVTVYNPTTDVVTDVELLCTTKPKSTLSVAVAPSSV